MADAPVTVAIPTYNRALLLGEALASVLAQDYEPLDVVVVDNASTDETGEIVAGIADSRVRYVRNEANVGAMRNWNRGLEVATGAYVCVFGDDDVMLPGFVAATADALTEADSAGLAFTLATPIDADGNVLDDDERVDVPDGYAAGLDYLETYVAGRACVINPSTALLRARAVAEVGPFASPHSAHTFDMNLYLRVAARFGVVFLRTPLVRMRVHGGQESAGPWRSGEGTGPFSDLAERIDAASYLLASERAADPDYRAWLARRLRALNARRSDFAAFLVDGLYSAEDKLALAFADIAGAVPAGETFAVVDEQEWPLDAIRNGRRAIRVGEREGTYWGSPADDASAIEALERVRAAGARFAVFAWPAFWWLEHYAGLDDHLRANFACVAENDRVVIFDLRPGGA